MKNVVVSIFGSSIMEGRIGVDKAADRWYNILQAKLSERFPAICFPIINGAVGGESTRECMARFDRDVLAYNPDYCLFMIGGNNHDCERPERILVENELERLMDEFAERLPKKTTPIGVILNPCVNEWHFATKNPAFRKYLKQYGGLDQALEVEREKFRKFIREHNWRILDLYRLFESDPGKYILHADGIHLSKAGHGLFAEKMFERMEKMIAAAAGAGA
ncbi:MAG: SGNH/GDSL hydrolase family protein [Kiritimatiellae bacterium]|nr:SGNH/GDSL hydrolase family protein [Kiritimatiellia bacterium]